MDFKLYNDWLPMELFKFGEGMFLMAYVVQRQKEHKEKVKEGPIKTYFLKNIDDYTKYKYEMIKLADTFGARIYITVSPKSIKKFQDRLALRIAKFNVENNLVNPAKIVNSVAGELPPENPMWIIDLDDVKQEDAVKKLLNKLYSQAHKKFDYELHKFYFTVETLNGKHIIAKPFNLKAFQEVFPDIDIHKNSMGTLLYVPKM